MKKADNLVRGPKNITVIVLLLLVLAVSAAAFYFWKEQNSTVRILHNEQISSETLTSQMIMQTFHASFRLDSNEQVWDLNGQKQTLASQFRPGETKLVLRFTENCCFECVEQELKLIGKIRPGFALNEVLILTSYSGPNDLRILKEKNRIPYQMVNIPQDRLVDNKIEKLSTPFLFLYDRTDGVQDVFIPNKTIPGLSERFYKAVAEHLIKNKYRIASAYRGKLSEIKFKTYAKVLRGTQLGKPETLSFDYINPGNHPLVIKKVIADCGCTAVDYSSSPLDSGGRGSVVVRFLPGEKGAFRRVVKIYSNAKTSPSSLVFEGVAR